MKEALLITRPQDIPTRRLVVELDGRDHHDKETDSRRDTDLLACGYATIRFTWRQIVNDAPWVTKQLTEVLDRRRPG